MLGVFVCFEAQAEMREVRRVHTVASHPVGELFAQAPVEQYPGIAVETVSDSSRYFVLRIQDDSGELDAFYIFNLNEIPSLKISHQSPPHSFFQVVVPLLASDLVIGEMRLISTWPCRTISSMFLVVISLCFYDPLGQVIKM